MWAFPWSQKTCIHFKYLVIIGYSQERYHPPWGGAVVVAVNGAPHPCTSWCTDSGETMGGHTAVSPPGSRATGQPDQPGSAPPVVQSKTLSPLWSQAIWARKSEETGNQLLLSAYLIGVTATPFPNPNLTLQCQTGSGRWTLPVLQRPLEVVCSIGNSQPFLLLLP